MQMGNTIAVKDSQVAPTVHWEADEHALYTLIMADPDAPSRKKATYRSWLHWIVSNSTCCVSLFDLEVALTSLFIRLAVSATNVHSAHISYMRGARKPDNTH